MTWLSTLVLAGQWLRQARTASWIIEAEWDNLFWVGLRRIGVTPSSPWPLYFACSPQRMSLGRAVYWLLRYRYARWRYGPRRATRLRFDQLHHSRQKEQL